MSEKIPSNLDLLKEHRKTGESFASMARKYNVKRGQIAAAIYRARHKLEAEGLVGAQNEPWKPPTKLTGEPKVWYKPQNRRKQRTTSARSG